MSPDPYFPRHAFVSIEPKFPNAAKSKYQLDVDLLPVRKIILGIYFVQDTPTSGELQIPANFKNASTIIRRLNEIFRQACVEFELAADSGVNEVAYDINNNHKLDLPPLFSGGSQLEYNAIFLPDPFRLIPKLNLLIVRDIDVPGKDAIGVTPEERASIIHPNRSVVETKAFEGENGNADDLEKFYTTCAHEIGHALGLSTRDDPQNGLYHDLGQFPLKNYMHRWYKRYYHSHLKEYV